MASSREGEGKQFALLKKRSLTPTLSPLGKAARGEGEECLPEVSNQLYVKFRSII
jgi:hypothetical protein